MGDAAGHDAQFTTPRATRPLPIRLANTLAEPFTRGIDLSGDAIVAHALKGLPPEAAKDIRFLPALNALCHSMQHESECNAIGRISARDDTVRLLRTQIRVNKLLREHPELLETPLPRPIYVIGLPRSGTTILHSVLAQDPAHRALLYYEGFDPSAPASKHPELKRKLGKMLKTLEYMAPSYRALHAMEAESIEECVTILYHSFSTISFEYQYECRGYLDFLEGQDYREAYAHYRAQLQLLQHHRPHGERWALKDPAHLVALDTLLELFPDAVFVWIHRDPTQVLSSIASLTAFTRALFSDAFDAERTGKSVLEGAWPRALRRGLELRDKLPARRFVDVRYSDFMRDPLKTMHGIYQRLDLDLSPAANGAMSRFLESHKQHAEGAHRHSLEQFGMDRETESRRYADYRKRFGLDVE